MLYRVKSVFLCGKNVVGVYEMRFMYYEKCGVCIKSVVCVKEVWFVYKECGLCIRSVVCV